VGVVVESELDVLGAADGSGTCCVEVVMVSELDVLGFAGACEVNTTAVVWLLCPPLYPPPVPPPLFPPLFPPVSPPLLPPLLPDDPPDPWTFGHSAWTPTPVKNIPISVSGKASVPLHAVLMSFDTSSSNATQPIEQDLPSWKSDGAHWLRGVL